MVTLPRIVEVAIEMAAVVAPILKSGKVLDLVQIAERMTVGAAKDCILSFAPDTPVLMADGGHRAIGSLRVGDLVTSRNEFTGIDSVKPILAKHINPHTDRVVLTVTSASNEAETITTTMGHPFWVVGQGFTPAGSLRAGQRVAAFQANNPLLTVSSRFNDASGALLVKAVQAQGSGVDEWLAWNLTVATDHTFFVGTGNAWVHNCNPFLKGVTKTGSNFYRVDIDVFEAEKIAFKADANILKQGENLEAAANNIIVSEKGILGTFDAKLPGNNGFDHAYAKMVDGEPVLVIGESKSGSVTSLLTAFGQGANGEATLARNLDQLSKAITNSSMDDLAKRSLHAQVRDRSFKIELYVPDTITSLPQTRINGLIDAGLKIYRIVVVPKI